MKKLLTNLSLAAAAILLLGSCAKINERIDELEGRINGLEKESIASISTQIESINSSIADLGTIRTNIQNLTSTTAAQAQDIADLNNEDTEIGKKISDLKKADESINTRIDNLQKYVNDTLKAYATTEWVNATFSTLAQYEATCDTIAKIDARIGSMDTRLSKSIEDCADSLKSWVNVQLDGYYTIAQMDAKVAEMNAQIDTLSSTSAATADSLKAEIAATKAEIDTVKANIRTEYKSAIETAITELDGKLSNELQTKISQVNLQINYLTARIDNLQTDVTTLTGKVNALEAMIQSVVIVPAYSDGSVKVEKDSLHIDCIVSPDTVVNKLDTTDVVILVNKVKTKAFAGVDTLKIVTGDLFEKDETNGSISIRVKILEKLPEAADSTITVAVNVKKGKSDYTTKFAPVNKPSVSVAPEGFVDLGVKTADGKPLYWAKKNLGADNPENFGNYYFWGSTIGYIASNDKLLNAGTQTELTGGVIQDNAPHYSLSAYTKYTSSDSKTVLEASDDAATQADTNQKWRTPTSDEFKALAANCVWIWCDGSTTKYNETSTKGFIVYKAKNDDDKGKANMNGTWNKWETYHFVTDGASEASGYNTTSDPHIFLPAASYITTQSSYTYLNSGVLLRYWCSDLYDYEFANCLNISPTNVSALVGTAYRYYCNPVRPVSE